MLRAHVEIEKAQRRSGNYFASQPWSLVSTVCGFGTCSRSGMEAGHFKEFQKMSMHLVSGAVRGPAMGEAGQVRRRSLAPSMSGGFSYEETSNVQEGEMQVPSWSHSCPLHSDQSSEDDQGCVPASQSSSPSKSNGLLLHCGNQNICKGDPRKDGAALFEKWAVATSQGSPVDHHPEDTGQPPPNQVRQTMLHQDALFRAQVQELHRLYKVQLELMSEMASKTTKHFVTPGQVDVNNKNSWASIQAQTLEKESASSSSMQERDSESEGDKEIATSRTDDSEQKTSSCEGLGRRPVKRRTFDLELPCEENMDAEEIEHMAAESRSKMEAEVCLRLRNGWAKPAVQSCPQSQHSGAPGREAPYRPTPTMASQNFLGGLWGLSLERKTEVGNEDWSSRHIAEVRPILLEVEEKPVHVPAPWFTQGNGSSSTQLKAQQEVRSQGICIKEAQKGYPWGLTTNGAFRAGSAMMPMRPPLQVQSPFNVTDERLRGIPTLLEGQVPPPPPGYNQGYVLAEKSVPALAGVKLGAPYEGSLKIPGQGLMQIPTMNAYWYPHNGPPFSSQQQQPQQQSQSTGWQNYTTSHSAPGAVSTMSHPAAVSVPRVGLNVDGTWSMSADGFPAASWSATANNSPVFTPFSIIPPLKPPFKKPPKLVLRQDGTAVEVKVSPNKNQSPSVSSDEIDGRQSMGIHSVQGQSTGHVGGAFLRNGQRPQREDRIPIVGSDCERGGRSPSEVQGTAFVAMQCSLALGDGCGPAGGGTCMKDTPKGGLSLAFRLGEKTLSTTTTEIRGERENPRVVPHQPPWPNHLAADDVDPQRFVAANNIILPAMKDGASQSQQGSGQQHRHSFTTIPTGHQNSPRDAGQDVHSATGTDGDGCGQSSTMPRMGSLSGKEVSEGCKQRSPTPVQDGSPKPLDQVEAVLRNGSPDAASPKCRSKPSMELAAVTTPTSSCPMSSSIPARPGEQVTVENMGP